ncbi:MULTISPECIES: MFS transporter [unclassified Lentimonas]|uniref:MFS transporter n=1 Tax=unclassified Lentimonas TaxID=2630993 RepID=UPI0013265817|nr:MULTISPECIES: MFS transporter [unclassified Lentimonas]CAA6680102.1 putative transport protein [Lentimonas sp. CC4]CAA6685082.1 putative transport protein [Lentimonas sp. CC6]CAA6691447.1 putative transport protein [Lentimonas sp. CC10]CAA6693183.1 putative transport protein [Lentimonas sp. CC19]CAA7068935.1 putative transport protein [Lentimonas sp. CC11]
MAEPNLEKTAQRNVRAFTVFRMFFSARFYYPVYALLFLDYGLTLEQFGILNGIWAATIVLLEVPSGALADTLGRRKLLILAGVLMVLEMAVLLVAPIGGGPLLFSLFVVNRVLSGAAEAAASGADEALAYDSLKAAGQKDRWGRVLERVQRDTSLAFFFAMMIGAAVYDADMVNAVLQFCGSSHLVEQGQLVKVPIFLSFLSALIVLAMALRMQEQALADQVSVRATLAKSWRQSIAASRWVWLTAFPFGVFLAAMVLDSVVRQFLTLASEYWNVIDLPIASYGLIGSGMALMGAFVPRLARLLADKYSPLQNFLTVCVGVLLGLVGLSMAIPYWGILPTILLYAGIQMTGYFVSRYLNDVAPSEQRATVLSFRGLSTNFIYGAVSLMYAGLITSIRSGYEQAGESGGLAFEHTVFVESLGWFPWYFLVTVCVVFMLYRLRFGKPR